jgi:acyl-CoA synthetase (AMP-forming)/AMP-acid ligase II
VRARRAGRTGAPRRAGGQGYWNDAEKTAERYKPLPAGAGREAGLMLPEYAVFSGDTVRMDAEGFLYFIGRRDEMMKTSGYRVSPTEVEEVLYATKLVGECVAFGVDHATLGQAIQVIATPPDGSAALDVAALLAECKQRMPAYMVPHGIEVRNRPAAAQPQRQDRPQGHPVGAGARSGIAPWAAAVLKSQLGALMARLYTQTGTR